MLQATKQDSITHKYITYLNQVYLCFPSIILKNLIRHLIKTTLTMEDLNEYLECTCGCCDDSKCQCCDCEHEHPQVNTSYEEINYDEYIDNLNDWD